MLNKILQYKNSNAISIGQFDPRIIDKFHKDFKSFLRNICESQGTTVSSYEPHNIYGVSSVLQRKDGTLITLTLSDVRHRKNFDMILIRMQDNGFAGRRSTLTKVENLGASIFKL